MDNTLLAYLAGAMDSDGYFTIKRSTYQMRRAGKGHPTYAEMCGLKQVTPQIPTLLHQTFGGALEIHKPSTPNGRPLHTWEATHRIASQAAQALLPHLLVKSARAQLVLQLRESREARYTHEAHWFERENPGWEHGPLLTTTQVRERIGYASDVAVRQALESGVLLAIPRREGGGKREQPRYPAALVDRIAETRTHAGRGSTPWGLRRWREDLWNRMRELNKAGVHGTPTYHRTGPYTPKPI